MNWENITQECNLIRINGKVDDDLMRDEIHFTPNLTHLLFNVKPELLTGVTATLYAMKVNYHVQRIDDKLEVMAGLVNNDTTSINKLVEASFKPILKINMVIKNNHLMLDNIQINIKNSIGEDWSLFTYIDHIVWTALIALEDFIHLQNKLEVINTLYSLAKISMYSKLFSNEEFLSIDLKDTQKTVDCVSRTLDEKYSDFMEEYKSAFNTPTSYGVTVNYNDPLLRMLINIGQKQGNVRRKHYTALYEIETPDYKYPLLLISTYKDKNYNILIRGVYEDRIVFVPRSVVEETIEYYLT